MGFNTVKKPPNSLQNLHFPNLIILRLDMQ